MDNVTDICKYHFLYFVTIIQVKIISAHQVKKVKQKISWFRAAIHVYRSDFRKEREKWPWRHFLKRQNRSKSKIRKITVNVPKWIEKCLFFTCFMLYLSHFWRYRLEVVYTFMRHCPLTYIMFFCWKFWFGGKLSRKEKKIGHLKKNWKFCKSEIAVL